MGCGLSDRSLWLAAEVNRARWIALLRRTGRWLEASDAPAATFKRTLRQSRQGDSGAAGPLNLFARSLFLVYAGNSKPVKEQE
jgi:hypothetical protein